MNGCFITFEGGEGAGKSTQIRMLSELLKKHDYEVVMTREPGGTAGAEALRHVILSGAAEQYGALTEACLFAAARADHMDELIIPALKLGKIVLCDRFIDSTKVYQGQSGKVSNDIVSILEQAAIGKYRPDITFILDIPVEIGMQRALMRRGDVAQADRFEKDTFETQQQRRQAFLSIANAESERCIIVDATKTQQNIAEEISNVVFKKLLEDSNG